MRRGEEEYFDPDKMHPGEWAVSTDTKYVRMCFSPGVCVRMATYEAFEEDMEQIIAILEEANTVKEAIEEIYKEFQEAELDIEAAENAAILSESYAKGGTGTREGEDTDNAKYYAELAKENIEPVMNAVSDISLNRQTLGYVKKNLWAHGDVSGTLSISIPFVLEPNTYTISTLVTSSDTDSDTCLLALVYDDATTSYKYLTRNSRVNLTFITSKTITKIAFFASSDWTKSQTDTFTFKDIQIELGDTATDYEPYVDDVDTRLKALTPVNNLLTTVEGSPLDATMGKKLGDRITTLEDAFINYYVSLINGWIGTLVVSVNKINKQVSITGFIDGTNATDTIFAKANIENNGVPVPVNAISLIVQQGYNNAFVTIGFSNSGNGWEAKAPSTSHVYQFSTGYIMSN